MFTNVAASTGGKDLVGLQTGGNDVDQAGNQSRNFIFLIINLVLF
jgi:hypothetical protein